jgi:hypothetical protein
MDANTFYMKAKILNRQTKLLRFTGENVQNATGNCHFCPRMLKLSPLTGIEGKQSKSTNHAYFENKFVAGCFVKGSLQN